VQCLNNMRNVGLAMQNFASSNNGALPSLWANQNVTPLGSAVSGVMTVGWPIQLLPALDNTALLKNIRANATISGSAALIANTEKNIALEVFGCPDDVDSYKLNGGLSFVVNAGHMRDGLGSGAWGIDDGNHFPGDIDWDQSGGALTTTDAALGYATGVFWGGFNGTNTSLEYVATGDGTSTTIMLTENLQAGNWHDANATRLGFGIRIPTAQMANIYLPAPTGYPTRWLKMNATGFSDVTVNPDDWFINRNLAAVATTSPRPASQHAGGVNVIFCNGSGKFLNENMDKVTYAQIMTSNAVTYGEQTVNEGSY
jgi:hypothetical protein